MPIQYDSSDDDESASHQGDSESEDASSGTNGSSKRFNIVDDDSEEDSDDDSEKFGDEQNEFQHRSNIARSENDVESPYYSDDPPRSGYQGDDNQRRRRMIIILGGVVIFLTIIGIVLGVVVFGNDDDEATKAASVPTPTTVAPNSSPVTPAPTTNPPTITPSVVPTPLPIEFVFDVVGDTFVEIGNNTPQATSETLLVQNGNGVDNFDAYALLEFDLAPIRSSDARRNLQRDQRALLTEGDRTYYLKLVLAENLGDGPAPKLTVLKTTSTLDLSDLQAGNFDPALAEPLTVLRLSETYDPTIPDNIFLSIPEAGDSIWIDLTDAIDNTSEDTFVVMIQNRDAVQAVGGGTKFYSSNSNFPPTMVVLVDRFTPTASPAPSASYAPSSKPSISQSPTTEDSFQPSLYPTISVKPSMKDSAVPSFSPTTSNAPSQTPSQSSAPSSSAIPTESAVPSLAPSESAAPSTSVKPSSLDSSSPTTLSDTAASEFPTNAFCLPCPNDQVLKYSVAKPWDGRSETCGDLRLGLLQNQFFLYDVSPEECSAVVDQCECEEKVACTPCDGAGNYFDNPNAFVNGVTCQEAQLALTKEEFAYGASQCALLQSTCSCLPPLFVCNICEEGEVLGDLEAIVETSIGATSCSELTTRGTFGYISQANCDALKAEGIPEACECDAGPSTSPSISTSPSLSAQPSLGLVT